MEKCGGHIDGKKEEEEMKGKEQVFGEDVGGVLLIWPYTLMNLAYGVWGESKKGGEYTIRHTGAPSRLYQIMSCKILEDVFHFCDIFFSLISGLGRKDMICIYLRQYGS